MDALVSQVDMRILDFMEMPARVNLKSIMGSQNSFKVRGSGVGKHLPEGRFHVTTGRTTSTRVGPAAWSEASLLVVHRLTRRHPSIGPTRSLIYWGARRVRRAACVLVAIEATLLKSHDEVYETDTTEAEVPLVKM